jgi:hypothetical protein
MVPPVGLDTSNHYVMTPPPKGAASVGMGQDFQSPDPNLYVFFGINHFIPEQQEFFNELLTEGDDSIRLNNVDAVSSEYFWFDQVATSFWKRLDPGIKQHKPEVLQKCGYDLQYPITRYIESGEDSYLWFLSECLMKYPPEKSTDVIDLVAKALVLARLARINQYPYAFYAADLSAEEQQKLNTRFHAWELMEIREYNAIKHLRSLLGAWPQKQFRTETPLNNQEAASFVSKRAGTRTAYRALPQDREQLKTMFLSAKAEGKVIFGIPQIYAYLQNLINTFKDKTGPKGRGKVVFSLWGSSHVEKKGLPKYLPPKTLSLSVILNGGKHDTRSIFDAVIEELGLSGQAFIWVLPGDTRDADLIIHLPTDAGSKLEYRKEPPLEGFDPQGVVTILRKQ